MEAGLTSQGHPRAIFQRAIKRGNLLVAETTLRVEIPRPTLGDLLELTALIAQKQPEWFSRVAARWLLKYLRAVDVWRAVAHALRGGGAFAGHFFGPHDSWASTPDMTFQTREQLDVLFAGFDVHLLKEQDEDGPAASGPKHWHVFDLIATKRRPG
jgi:hypothetical protein